MLSLAFGWNRNHDEKIYIIYILLSRPWGMCSNLQGLFWMKKGISFRPFCGLLFFPRQKFGMAPFMEGAHGVLLCKNGIDPLCNIYIWPLYEGVQIWKPHVQGPVNSADICRSWIWWACAHLKENWVGTVSIKRQRQRNRAHTDKIKLTWAVSIKTLSNWQNFGQSWLPWNFPFLW